MKRIMAFLVFVLLAISVSVCSHASSNNRGAKFEGSWKLLSKESDMPPPIVSVPVDLIFFDENEGIATNFFQVAHTVDGGKEWIRGHDFYAQDISVHSFILAGDQQVLGVGARLVDEETRIPTIVRSKDRGKTWSQVGIDFGDEKELSKESVTFVDICFTSPENAWLVSNAGLIETTVREPSIKIEKVFRTEEELSRVSCSSTGRVIGVGPKGAAYRYDDRGLSRLHPPSEFTFLKVKQIDDHIWIMGWKARDSNSNSVATGMSGIVLFSADGGATWENRAPKEIRFFSDIDLRNGKGWLTGSDGNLFFSDDNGKSWREIVVPTKSHLYNIFFLDKRNIWIGGLNSTVLKYGVD
jgi:photosystem II stability/assembly factor-like uncharacterized protein